MIPMRFLKSDKVSREMFRATNYDIDRTYVTENASPLDNGYSVLYPASGQSLLRPVFTYNW